MAIRKASHTVLSNHFYTFGGSIRRQTKGGSIGSELTGEISRIYMLRWDRKFLTKLRRLGLSPYIYTRYVDDTLIMVDVIRPDVAYKSGKLIWIKDKDTIARNKLIHDDARTFSVLREIANSIDQDIQWEEDVPTNHEDQKLPCLDMKIWYSVPDRMILHEFYKKSMSSKFLIMRNSAVSMSTKRN